MCQPAGFSAKELQLSAEVAPQTGRKPWQGWRGLILLLFLALSTSSSQCSDPPCSCQTLAYLHLVGMAGNILNFSISNAPPGSKYDLYFRNSFVGDNWRFRRVCSGIQVDTDGQASFQLRKPDPQQGIFVLLDAGDDDGDGLPNGYECFFTYNGNYTSCDSGDSDNDGLQDAWEVAHPGISHPSTFKIYEKEIPGEPELHCDFIFVSADLARRVRDVRVDQTTQASDHQPVLIEL